MYMNCIPFKKKKNQNQETLIFRVTYGTQSAEHLTLDFGSGHDLRVVRSSTTSGSKLDSVLWAQGPPGILSLPLPPLMLVLSQ